MRARGVVCERPGKLHVPMCRRLHWPEVRDEHQRMLVRALPERRYLPRPDRAFRLRLHGRFVHIRAILRFSVTCEVALAKKRMF